MRYQLVLQWPSSVVNFEALIALENLLESVLSADHQVDGNDFGSGDGNIFILTDDPKAAFAQVQSVLSGHPAWHGLRARYRDLEEEEDDDDPVNLWPTPDSPKPTRKRPARKRQKYAEGDVLRAAAANGQPIYARVFEDDPAMGPIVGVYDSLAMPETDLDAIIQRPLAVKAFPIHYQILRNPEEWRVIGNRPLSPQERKATRGPRILMGSNGQLEAANHYYGLARMSFSRVEELLVRGNRRN
jgi:hypothetical protein